MYVTNVEKIDKYIFNSSNVNGEICKVNNNEYYFLRDVTPGERILSLTDNYMEITVDVNIPVTHSYGKENFTVKDQFDNFEEREFVENYNPVGIYTFNFENGKCVEVMREMYHN